jgi:hypothetical protein
MAHSEAVRKLLEHLQSDLKNISLEAKRRHPGVKESAEEAIVKAGNSLHGCRTPRMVHVPLLFLAFKDVMMCLVCWRAF